jgi:UDPglucose 6-dehydrogenase
VLTEWDEFKHLDYARIRKLLHHPTVVDGRNPLSPEEMRKLGFNYLSMGRPDVILSEMSREAEQEAVA